jgi:hypothetical protein
MMRLMSIVCFIRYDIAFAQAHRFILREERTFLEVVDGTFAIPSAE